MKRIASLICAGGLWAATALAQSPVTLTIDAKAPGAAIPDDFIGLSFEIDAVLPGAAGTHFLSATNTPLITILQNLGVRHLRAGGGSVDWPPDKPIPSETDIDNLFAFARTAGVKKIIYSLRLIETDHPWQYAGTNAVIAKYSWTHHRSELECFSLGNEPDRKALYKNDLAITNFTTYLEKWQKRAASVTNAVPEAKFAGPDAGSQAFNWTTRFAEMEKNSGLIEAVTEHYYPGGKGKGVEAWDGIQTMLSQEWVKAYHALYKKMAAPVLSSGAPLRFTEANDHYSGGVPGASDTFAGALWALDFLHWWAAHETSSVDFHNKLGNVNVVITRDPSGQLRINPKGYGLKAFDLGGHGSVAPVAISNPDSVNLTAYAVRGGGNLFVTVINKDCGAGARPAAVTILSDGISTRAETISLTSPGGDVAAKTGVTLGGAAIGNDGPWSGKWTPLTLDKPGQCALKVAAASAVVVKIATD